MRSPTLRISSFAAAMSPPEAAILPISFEAALRFAFSVSVSAMRARRFASRSLAFCSFSISTPRRPSSAAVASNSSLSFLMSIIFSFLRRPQSLSRFAVCVCLSALYVLRDFADVLCWCGFACQRAALFRATVLALRERPIPASFAPLGVYIYAVGGESCRNRLTLEGSAPLIDIAFGDFASLRGIPASAQNKAALGTLGSWANGACVRLSLRGKARLLPRAASTVRSAILRRRDTASSSRLRPLAHHANCRRAVPLRSLLTHTPLARPSAMARFPS